MLRYDPSHLFVEEHGLSEEEIGTTRKELEHAITWFMELHTSGRVGIVDLALRDDLLDQSAELASELRARFDDVVVLGIGGSSLGPHAIYAALQHPYHHLLKETDLPRLHFPDNVDPHTFTSLLDVLNLERTLFVVITKSGGTAETASQFMIVYKLLEKTYGAAAARSQIITITDPQKGNLRALTSEMGWKSLPVPEYIEGRFSVLSPVGLFPAAMAGVDVSSMIAGARDMARQFLDDPVSHPASVAAQHYWLLHTRHGKSVHVLMPYSDGLYFTAQWFMQLWGESLGKRVDNNGREIFTGPTPVAVRGTTDQHSQLQLYIEGPFDKVITFMAFEKHESDVKIPNVFKHLDSYSYLGGHTMGELFDTERRATALSLFRERRPNATVYLSKLDAYSLGQVFMFYELATAVSGGLYHINPFNQPGVEHGKKLTYGALGRPGFEEFAGLMK